MVIVHVCGSSSEEGRLYFAFPGVLLATSVNLHAHYPIGALVIGHVPVRQAECVELSSITIYACFFQLF